MEVRVENDVVRFEGYDVAVLADGVPTTVMGRFVELIDGAAPEEEVDEQLTIILDEILKESRSEARAGLVRMSALTAILERKKKKHLA